MRHTLVAWEHIQFPGYRIEQGAGWGNPEREGSDILNGRTPQNWRFLLDLSLNFGKIREKLWYSAFKFSRILPTLRPQILWEYKCVKLSKYDSIYLYTSILHAY